MPKFLIYTDLQATEGHERLFSDPTRSLQDYRVEKFYETLDTAYAKHSCDGIIDLGDTTNDRSAIPVPALNRVLSSLDRLPDSEWNVKLIGNHEQYFKRDVRVHVGQLFQSKFGIVEKYNVMTHGKVALLFCAYQPDDQETTAWITQQIAKFHKYRKVLFGHFQVAGSRTNSGVLSTGVPLDLLSHLDLCLLGHIHKPQTLGESVHYVGSPFQQDFGEAGEDKRIALLDIDFESGDLALKWIPMRGFPEYLSMPWTEFSKTDFTGREDRIKVVLKTRQESEQFYAHAMSSRAEPVYAYTTEESATASEKAYSERTHASMLADYLKLAPPDGISLPLDEMLAIGLTLAEV